MTSRIGLNTYTLKDHLRSAEEIKSTLARVSKMGYKMLELDLGSLLASMEIDKLNLLLNELKLDPVSAHVEFEQLENSLDEIVDNCKSLGTEFVVAPNLPRDRFCNDAVGYRKGSALLYSFADSLQEKGIKFVYHNHAREFEKYDGKVAMNIIFEEGRKSLLAEIDVYWVQYGGGDPSDWIRKLAGRVPLVHLKDMGMVRGKQLSMEVGEGNLNWQQTLKSCMESGVKWYIIEQEDFLRDPFESVRMSKENLEKMGIT